MRQILYVSNTSRDFASDALLSILDASRRNNAGVGVTGLLLYIDGGFLQVLEGEADAVETTFHRISGDPRHWNVHILLDRPTAERSFSQWTMGFERLTAENTDEAVFALSNDAIAGRLSGANAAELATMMRAFYRVQSSGF